MSTATGAQRSSRVLAPTELKERMEWLEAARAKAACAISTQRAASEKSIASWKKTSLYYYIYIYIYYTYIYIISINYGIAMNSPYSKNGSSHIPQAPLRRPWREIITPDLPLVAPLAKSARKPTYPALAPWVTWSLLGAASQGPRHGGNVVMSCYIISMV